MRVLFMWERDEAEAAVIGSCSLRHACSSAAAVVVVVVVVVVSAAVFGTAAQPCA